MVFPSSFGAAKLCAAAASVNQSNHSARNTLGAMLLLATAVALRFYDLNWGLPEGVSSVDERVVWPSRLSAFVKHGLSEQSLLPNRLVYPPVVGYVMGLVNWAVRSLGLAETLPAAPSMAGILVGRVVTASLDVATVGLTGLFAARLYSPREGWVAAALMAVCPLAVGQAHYLSVDPISGTVVPVVGLAALALHRTPTFGRAIGAGIACGLAFGIKYNGLALGILPAVSLVAILLRDGPKQAVVLALTVFAAFLASASVFCLPCLLYWDTFMAFMEQYLWYASLGANVTAYGISRKPYFFLFTLPGALGWLGYLAAWLGFGVALVRRRFEDVLVLVATVALVVPLTSSQFFLRYLLPTLPLLAVLGARGLGALPEVGRARTVATAATVVGGLVVSLFWVPMFSTDQVFAFAGSAKERPGRIAVLAINPMGARFSYDYLALRSAKITPAIVSATGKSQPGTRMRWIPLAESCSAPRLSTLVVSDTLRKFWAKNQGVIGEPFDDAGLLADAPCWVREERFCRTCALDEWLPWWWPGRGGYSFGAPDFEVYTKRPALPVRLHGE